MTPIERGNAIELLRRATELALDESAGRCLFVNGPVGAGKTALVSELLNALADERPEVAIARGRCVESSSRRSSYLPFVDALRDLADERTAGSIRTEAVTELIKELAPYWFQLVPLVGGVLAAGFSMMMRARDGPGSSEAESSTETQFLQFRSLVKRLAERGPLILFLDDLQWADPPSLGLLAHLGRSIERLPVVIIVSLDAGAGGERVEAARELMYELQRERLASTVQLSRSRAHATSAVEQTIRRLDAEEILLLQYASVLGLEFDSVALAQMLQWSEVKVLKHLESLQRTHGLLKEEEEASPGVSTSATQFRFDSPDVHGLVHRQVAGRRRALLEGKAESLRTSATAPRAQPKVPPSQPPTPSLATRAGAESPGDADIAIPRAPTQFVGREQELERLRSGVGRALDGAGGVFFAEGPAGAGKTMLITEFLHRIDAERGDRLAVAVGRCLPSFGGADPYLPFTEALADVSDDAATGFSRPERFAEMLADVAPFWVGAIPVVGNVLSAVVTTATTLRGHSDQVAPSREALFAQYLEMIRRLSERAPLILFLDDLHWADQGSIELLIQLGRSVAGLPVAVLGTYRPDEEGAARGGLLQGVEQLEQEGAATRLVLDELSANELDALLAVEFGGDVADPLRRWIVSTAGGNPLFASELCRLLRETGAAAPVHGEWHLTQELDALEVPPSAASVIEKRVERLDPGSIDLLRYASVDGNEFTAALLARMLGEDEAGVLKALGALESEHRLVHAAGAHELPDGRRTALFQFRHALVQTVVYAGQNPRRRMLLHREAGRAIEHIYHHDAADHVAGRLARHFHAGGLPEPAHRYASMAADSARRLYANWEAEELLRIALEHSPDSTETARLQEALGDVYGVVGYYARATQAYAAADEVGGNTATSRSLRLARKTVTLDRKAGSAPASDLLKRVRRLLEKPAREPGERARLLLELCRLPEGTDVIAAAREAVDLAERLSDSALLAEGLEQLGVALFRFGHRPSDALEPLQRAFRVSGGTSDPLRAARYYNITGVIHIKLGDFDRARTSLERMLETAERLGDPNGIGAACDCLGCLLFRMGEYEAAERLLQRAKVLHERRDRRAVLHSLDNLAVLARERGENVKARTLCEELLERAREFQYPAHEIVAYAGIGLCSLESGNFDAARAAAESAKERLSEWGDQWFEDREQFEILLARVEAVEGHLDRACERLERTSLLLADDDRYLWAVVELERARLLVNQDAAAAAEIVRAVRESAGHLQSEPLRKRITGLEQRLGVSVARGEGAGV